MEFRTWILCYHTWEFGEGEILTLNMLNYFKDYQRCIHISYHYFDFGHQKKTQIHNGAILHVACPILSIPCLLRPWRLRIQGISRPGIDTQSQNIAFPASEELTMSMLRKRSLSKRPVWYLLSFWPANAVAIALLNFDFKIISTYWLGSSMVQIMACHDTFVGHEAITGTIDHPLETYCRLDKYFWRQITN